MAMTMRRAVAISVTARKRALTRVGTSGTEVIMIRVLAALTVTANQNLKAVSAALQAAEALPCTRGAAAAATLTRTRRQSRHLRGLARHQRSRQSTVMTEQAFGQVQGQGQAARAAAAAQTAVEVAAGWASRLAAPCFTSRWPARDPQVQGLPAVRVVLILRSDHSVEAASHLTHAQLPSLPFFNAFFQSVTAAAPTPALSRWQCQRVPQSSQTPSFTTVRRTNSTRA